MKPIFKSIFVALGIALSSGCSDEFELNYQAPVTIAFEGVDASNIVTLDKGTTAYTAKIRVTGSSELNLFELYEANPTTGALGAVIESATHRFGEGETSYSTDYTLPSVLENTALAVQVTDVHGNTFQRRLLVRITPSVYFTKEVKMETAEVYYGIYFASWLDGRVYMRNTGGAYASEIDFSLGEVAETTGGSTTPMLVSPAKRGDYGLMNIAGVQDTKFAVTTLTAEDFEAITRRDMTPIQSVADPTESAVKLESGKIYVFKTAAGRKGLLRVSSLTDKTATVEVAPDEWVENTPYREVTVMAKFINE